MRFIMCANLYSDVNELVSNGKKIIVKSNERRDLFNNKFPDIPLPPEPVRTRWGLWIDSVGYYAKNFNNFCEFVKMLDPNESTAIESAHELINKQKSSLIRDLSYINANFLCLKAYKTIRSPGNASLR